MFELLKKYIFKHGIYLTVTKIKGYSITRDIDCLNQSQYFSKPELEAFQRVKLEVLVESAKKSEHYKYINEIRTSDSLENWLSNLPILEKTQLRTGERTLLTRQPTFRDTKKTSGGSTGAAVTVFKNPLAMSLELAAAWRAYNWAGIDLGDFQARFWGVPHTKISRMKAKLTDLIARRIRFSAFSFSSSDLQIYADTVKRRKPKYFYGYVSLLRELAEYSELNDLQNAYDSVTAVFPTSEVLTDKDRGMFEQVFGAAVYNEYGCGEVGTIAHECEKGSMHINEENVFVEVLDENDQPVPPGHVGQLVVTDLNNTLMPLIRYKLGDMGSLSHGACDCGRSLKILANVSGRAYDLVKNRKGQVFHGEFFLYFIEELKGSGHPINGVQFLISDDEMTVKIVCANSDFKSIENKLVSSLRHKFCKETPVKVTRVSSIERESSGKLRVVKYG